MFLRVDKLQVELSAPLRQGPNAAAALQELVGGKYGEMSTLGNYMFQSFNFGNVNLTPRRQLAPSGRFKLSLRARHRSHHTR